MSEVSKKYEVIPLEEMVLPLRKAYSETVINNIDRVVEGPDTEIKNLWQKYKDAVKINNPNYKGSQAYFSSGDGAVLHDMDQSRKGNGICSPYQTSFHEFGHNIDHAINQRIGDKKYDKFYSESYKDGLLGKTAKTEVAAFIKQYQHDYLVTMKQPISYNKACELITYKLTAEIPLLERADISDMFEGATGAKICLGAGHGKEYWKDRDNGIEVFAEMFSASVCNFGSLNAIKTYFPETYKVFQEMVRSA
jgi:hypothetical protein